MANLRSARWYFGQDRNAYLHRVWMRRGRWAARAVGGEGTTLGPQAGTAGRTAPLEDAMAELRAYLPATDATRNYRTLDQYAQAAAPGDERTMDQSP